MKRVLPKPGRGLIELFPNNAEEILGVKLPNQYVDYIKMFGHGGIAGG